MSIEEYRVEVSRDAFEFDESVSGLSFPCCACVHRFKDQFSDPCGTCAHNCNSSEQDQPHE